jgi:hypothetical protein
MGNDSLHFDSIMPLLGIMNPSFEGTPTAHVLPPYWGKCMPGVTPDTQPGFWGVNLPASDGNSYLGFVNQPSTGWQEGASQTLSSPMLVGEKYNYSIDLATMASADPSTGIELPPYCGQLQVWGGMSTVNSGCDQSQLLWTSPVITNTVWQSYIVSFTPDSAWDRILFVIYTPLPACTDGQYILLDNFAPAGQICGSVTANKKVVVKSLSNINSNDNSKLKVYPNPCTDYLYFEKVRFVEVYDFTGALRLREQVYDNRLNVSCLDNGLYLYVITDENDKKHYGKFEKFR